MLSEEDVQVDIAAAADVAGQRAADQPRPEDAQQAHHSQRLDPHLAQILGALVPFEQAGEDLDLVANLPIAGQILGFDPAASHPLGGFQLGPVILGLDALVHQAGGFPGDLLPQLAVKHETIAPKSGPSKRRRAGCEVPAGVQTFAASPPVASSYSPVRSTTSRSLRLPGPEPAVLDLLPAEPLVILPGERRSSHHELHLRTTLPDDLEQGAVRRPASGIPDARPGRKCSRRNCRRSSRAARRPAVRPPRRLRPGSKPRTSG